MGSCWQLVGILIAGGWPLVCAAGSALDPQSAWDGHGPEPAYVRQDWPRARVLTWANPGRGGELSRAENWLEGGRPAARPPDYETDVILPPAARRYTVTAGSQRVRHLDVGKNAELYGEHRKETEVWGNCWIHPGGYVLFIAIRGDRHAFIKNEQAEFPSLENGLKYRGPKSKGGRENATQLSHKLQVCKYGTASIEFIGKFGVGDEIQLQHGRLIVNGELRWSGYTGKGALEIYDGGILELQSGSRIMPFDPLNQKAIYNIDIYCNGMLQAGSPERPLTADVTVYLGFGENDQPGRTGLYGAQGSMISVFSSDPTRHRLVFSSTAEFPDLVSAALKPIPPIAPKASGSVGTQLQLAGELALDGVHFDYLCAGGLAIAEHIDPQSWQHITYGPGCADAELLSPMRIEEDVYYHARNDGESEFALVTTAVSSMQEYLKTTDAFQITTLPPSTTRGGNNPAKQPRDQRLVRTEAIVYRERVLVTVDCQVSGARIRYTTDGTEPTRTSAVYSGPIELSKTTKLTVKAYKNGLGFSPTYTTVYVVQ
jgi:hypothetical protein